MTRPGVAGPTRPTVRRRQVTALARADARTLARDPFLLVMLAAPVLLVGVIRLATGPVGDALEATAVDASAHHALAAGFLVAMLVPHLLGALTGLVLLDERDAGLLLALRVSPLGLGGYLAYRLIVTGTLSATAVALALPASGLVAGGSLQLVITVALLAGMLAGVPALLLPALASNKVEGLAVFKAAGLPLLSPALAWFVIAPWRWAFGLVPTAWPAFVLWDGLDGTPHWPLAAVIGALYLALWVGWLARRLIRRVLLA